MKKPKSKGKRTSLPGVAEMLKRADLVFQGALAVIKKNGIVRAREEPLGGDLVPTYKKGTGKTRIAPPVPEIVAYAKGEGKGLKKTHLIRAVALAFPTASVAEIRASLPDQNPATVGIQTRWARTGKV